MQKSILQTPCSTKNTQFLNSGEFCKIHHRSLQVIHNDYQKSYDELLEINKDVNINQKHLRILAVEVFKSIMHFNPEFIWSYFNENAISEMEIDYYYHLLNL